MSFAALVCPNSSRCELRGTVATVLQSLRTEWEMVLSAESDAEAADLFKKSCPQCTWQCYRELMTTLEAEDWIVSSRSAALVEAWIPRVNGSCNIEDIFQTMADTINRGTRTEMASLPSLQAVQIRACQQKLVGNLGQPRGIQLSGSDYEGAEVRGLKAKLFQPTSFTGRSLVRICLCTSATLQVD